MELQSNIPSGPLAEKWDKHRFEMKLVNPANKRKYKVLVVGTGLAGAARGRVAGRAGLQRRDASASRTVPRRAHSIAAQGGINAAKNYQNDGDSVYRLFYDTIKGGDFRSREANVYRLAQVSRQHHRPVRRPGRAVRPRVRRPARQPLLRRRPGVAHLLLPRPDRPAAPARRLLRPCAGRSPAGRVKSHPRTEMLDLVVVDGRARGIVVRDLVTGQVSQLRRRRGRPGHRRLRPGVLPLHQRQGLQRHGHLPRLQARGRLRQPLLHADPPDLHPGDRRPPVQADAHVRVAAQRRPHLGAEESRRQPRRPTRSPKPSATTTWSGSIPSYGNLAPRDIASRAAKEACDEGRGVGPGGRGVYLDFAEAISDRHGRDATSARSTATCSTCTPTSPARTPTRRRCASIRPPHYTHGRAVGGLQPDEQRFPGCSCWARPTSPITAPTASAPAP